MLLVSPFDTIFATHHYSQTGITLALFNSLFSQE